MQSLASEFWIVFFGRGVQILLGLASLRAISSLLAIDQLGYYYLITAIVSWFSLVFMNPVGMYANRKANQWNSDQRLFLATRAIFLYCVGLGIACLPSVILLDFIFNFSKSGSSLALSLAVASQVAFCGLGQTFLSILNLTHSRKVYVLTAVFTQALILLLAVTFSVSSGASAYAWIGGVAGANLLGAILCFLYFLTPRAPISRTTKMMDWREIKAFALPILMATLLSWTQTQGYRLFIEGWLGREALARLSIALGTALSIFASIEAFMNQYFLPKLYRAMDDPKQDSKVSTWSKLGSTIIVSYLTIFCGCLFIAPNILRVLVAPAYHDLSGIFMIGLTIEFFRVTTNLANLITHSEWSAHRSLLPYAFGVLVIVIGGGIQYFVGNHNLEAFALILAVSGIATSTTMWMEARKLIFVRIPWREGLFVLLSTLPILPLNWLPYQSGLSPIIYCAIAGVWVAFLLFRTQAKNRLALSFRQK